MTMAQDHHAAYHAAMMQQKAAREIRRDENTRALLAAGVTFKSIDNGWQLRIEHRGQVIDFKPGPGTWSMQGDRRQRHGVRELISYLTKESQ